MPRTAHRFTSPYLLRPTRSLFEACWAYHRERGMLPPCATHDSAAPREVSATGASSETATSGQCVAASSCPFRRATAVDKEKKVLTTGISEYFE